MGTEWKLSVKIVNVTTRDTKPNFYEEKSGKYTLTDFDWPL